MVFGWLAIMEKILTIESLITFGGVKKILEDGCIMCSGDAEIVNHLSVNCKVAQQFWTSLLGWCDCRWVLPNSLCHLSKAWNLVVGSTRERVMWRATIKK